MGLFKGAAARALALSLALAMAPAAMPAGTPLLGISEAQAGWHDGRWHRHHYGPRPYRRHYRHYGGFDPGAAVAIGILGLGIGLAIGAAPYDYRPVRRPYYYGAAPRPWSGGWYRYCAAKYRSFDPRSGTFQPYHGPRRLCR